MFGQNDSPHGNHNSQFYSNFGQNESPHQNFARTITVPTGTQIQTADFIFGQSDSPHNRPHSQFTTQQ